MKWYLLALAALCCPLGAFAATTDRVVAVVNDEIITLSELKARTTLAARAMNVNLNDPRAGNALLRRTLGELVDETLQQQYAARMGMQLTKAEFQAAKDGAISAMGQTEWSALTKGIAAAGDKKIRAEATWARLMAAAVAPRVQMGTAELDKLIEEMSKVQNRTERNLSLIFVPQEEAEAKPVSGTAPTAAAKVLDLRAQATAPGATVETFAALAKANSAAPSAKEGGALGWLTVAEIPPAVANGIQGLGKDEVSYPIRTPDGWLLVRVNDVRADAASLSMEPVTEYRLLLLAASKPSATEQITRLQDDFKATVKAHQKSFEAEQLFTTSETLVRFDRSSSLGWVPQSALQPAVQKAVRDTRPGRWTDVLDTPQQLSALFVLESRQVMPPAVLALRQRVAQNLRANRTELEARRFMRELRQRAFVDIRF